MKKMYEEGDDNMKRSIAEAWTKANDKKAQGGAPDFSDRMDFLGSDFQSQSVEDLFAVNLGVEVFNFQHEKPFWKNGGPSSEDLQKLREEVDRYRREQHHQELARDRKPAGQIHH